MEKLNNIEKRKSVKEGGLESGIEKMRDEIEIFKSIIDQIEHLQKVPQGYTNLGEKVDMQELPALDQSVEYRGTYEEMQKTTEKALAEAHRCLMTQLTLLRNQTGVPTKEEAMKFDINTGRQDKDK